MPISCIDHKGQQFPSIEAMCRHWNVNSGTYATRIRQGLSLQESLEGPSVPFFTDHLGQRFPSVEQMANHWGINPGTLHHRLNSGWDIKDALTKPPAHQPVKDFLGNTFPSIAALCRHYNITEATYKTRIDRNWSLKDTLTTPSKHPPITGDDGKIYPSIAAYCRAIGIHPSTYNSRKQQGKSVSGPPGNKVACTDHLGKTYTSRSAMAKAYGINLEKLRYRLDHGWSLEDALTKDVKPTDTSVIDPISNKTFSSLQNLCKHYGLNYSTVFSRMKNGMTLKEALSAFTENTQIDEHVKVLQKIEDIYYAVVIDNTDDIWTHHQIVEYIRKHPKREG